MEANYAAHQTPQFRVLSDRQIERVYRATLECLQRTGVNVLNEEARDLLAALPPRDRVVLTLRVLHGLAFRDVAAALGISEEAAKKRAQRALRRLRVFLQAEALGPQAAGDDAATG